MDIYSSVRVVSAIVIKIYFAPKDTLMEGLRIV